MESTNRIKATITMNPEISQRIRTLSTTTMIPMSRLVERAILEYLARRQEAEGAGTKQRA